MPPNHFESEVGNFLEGSHGDRTHIKRADHHTVTPLCGTLLPPGGLNTAALRDLIRDDENTQWDIATTAEYLGISAHTLRYYERAGLVKVGRDASGYRLYDAAAVRRLVFITRMRVSGMSIAQLQHYISLVEQGAETVQERLDLMLEHRDILRQRIEDLQLSLAATEFKIAMYQKGSRP